MSSSLREANSLTFTSKLCVISFVKLSDGFDDNCASSATKLTMESVNAARSHTLACRLSPWEAGSTATASRCFSCAEKNDWTTRSMPGLCVPAVSTLLQDHRRSARRFATARSCARSAPNRRSLQGTGRSTICSKICSEIRPCGITLIGSTICFWIF